VSVEVENTGDRRGIAVPQMYVSLPSRPGVPQPPKALAGFKRIALKPGQSRRVSFSIERRALSYWDVDSHRFKPVSGCGEILVGRDARHTPLTTPLGLTKPCG
jgi:beta-glucosidase